MELEKQNAIEIGWTICVVIAELSFGKSFTLICYILLVLYRVMHDDFIL